MQNPRKATADSAILRCGHATGWRVLGLENLKSHCVAARFRACCNLPRVALCPVTSKLFGNDLETK
jgi:hypothetical protein